MSIDKSLVRAVLDEVRADNRTALNSSEASRVCAACQITTPAEALAQSASEAVSFANDIGYPVVLKVVSPDILHKTDAGGVATNLDDAAAVEAAFAAIMTAAKGYAPDANILGIQVQQQLPAAQEVIIGATSDPSFGKLVAFGLGGVLVEVLKDITFRLAPTTPEKARSMLDEIAGAAVLGGVRGGPAVDRDALAALITTVSELVDAFPEIEELDLNPVFATESGAIAVDVRILVNFAPAQPRFRPSEGDILAAMQRIMQPRCGSGHRRIGRRRQDWQLGDEKPDQRRIRG